LTAFATAWALMKMPIVPNSLHEIETSPNKDKSWKSLFQDPKTNEILPLYTNYNTHKNREGEDCHSYSGRIGERGESTGKLSHDDEWNKFGDTRQSITRVHWVDGYKPPNPAWTETKRDVRGRGYAPALYDVIAYLMSQNQGMALTPSKEQKASAKNMWKEREEWPVRDDL
jgi:hypothetical protein